jgi:hypothetical protein
MVHRVVTYAVSNHDIIPISYLYSNGWMAEALHNAGYDLTITAQGVCNLTVIVTCAGAVVFQASGVRSRKIAIRKAYYKLIDRKGS